jgi:hypothetical protein
MSSSTIASPSERYKNASKHLHNRSKSLETVCPSSDAEKQQNRNILRNDTITYEGRQTVNV